MEAGSEREALVEYLNMRALEEQRRSWGEKLGISARYEADVASRAFRMMAQEVKAGAHLLEWDEDERDSSIFRRVWEMVSPTFCL